MLGNILLLLVNILNCKLNTEDNDNDENDQIQIIEDLPILIIIINIQ